MFTAMVAVSGWKLCFVLLLPTSWCFRSQVTLVKTVGNKPDVTPICSNETQHLITLIVCKIGTERNGQECRLAYRYGQDLEQGCGSRFSLLTKDHIVFLRLSNLTAADGGRYSCECSHSGGTDILHINVTVVFEGEEVSSSTRNYILMSSVVVSSLIIVAGVLLGFIHQRRSHRSKEAAGLSVHETPGSLDGNEPDDPYMSLQHPESDPYQTISSANGTRAHLDNEGPSYEIYENICSKSM